MTLGLEGWLEKLANKKIPVLKQRRDQMLDFLHDDSRASLAECQSIVLSDPLMTASLFRQMNLQRRKEKRLEITTISNLLSLYGVSRLIREIEAMVCIEDLGLSDSHLKGIQTCLKQSWYCSWFAMRWTADRGVKEPEEVHVAAVLQSVPELMLWCYGDDAMLQINHHAYWECKVYYEEVANVLGCNKRQIGSALAEKWALPELAGFGFETSFNAYTHGTAIGLAAVLARICQHGWYGTDMEFFHQKATHYFGEEENRAAIHLHRQLLDMVDDELEQRYRPVAFMLLFTDNNKYPEKEYCLSSLIQQQNPEQASSNEAADFDRAVFVNEVTQFKELVKQRADLNKLLKHLVLTVHKTLGFERVVFLMPAKDSTKLTVKINLFSGQADDALKQLTIETKIKGLFSQLMQKPQSFCLNSRNYEKFWIAVPGNVKSLTKAESFCAVSIFSGGRAIGMMYADKLGNEVNPELFKAFQQITTMMNKALELLNKKPQ